MASSLHLGWTLFNYDQGASDLETGTFQMLYYAPGTVQYDSETKRFSFTQAPVQSVILDRASEMEKYFDGGPATYEDMYAHDMAHIK